MCQIMNLVRSLDALIVQNCWVHVTISFQQTQVKSSFNACHSCLPRLVRSLISHLLRNDLGVSNTLRAEAKRGHSASVCFAEWARNTEKVFQEERCSPNDREKHSKSVRKWKKKGDIVLYFKLHIKKIN